MDVCSCSPDPPRNSYRWACAGIHDPCRDLGWQSARCRIGGRSHRNPHTEHSRMARWSVPCWRAARRSCTRGLHILAYDRPGYGRSSPNPGRTVASCAEDVRAITLALGIDRLGVSGASGGGPHALALGALLPNLVTGVAAICSLAPHMRPVSTISPGCRTRSLSSTGGSIMTLMPPAAVGKELSNRGRGYSAEQIEQLVDEEFPDDPISQAYFRSYTESMQSGLEPGIEG